MKFSNVRLLVRDYEKCFRFYTEKLGLEAAFDIEGCYGSFKVAEGIEGLAIFTSDLMAPVAGNADKELPAGWCRLKSTMWTKPSKRSLQGAWSLSTVRPTCPAGECGSCI